MAFQKYIGTWVSQRRCAHWGGMYAGKGCTLGRPQLTTRWSLVTVDWYICMYVCMYSLHQLKSILLTGSRSLVTSHCSLLSACWSLLAAHWLLITASCSLFTVYFWQLVACYFACYNRLYIVTEIPYFDAILFHMDTPMMMDERHTIFLRTITLLIQCCNTIIAVLCICTI